MGVFSFDDVISTRSKKSKCANRAELKHKNKNYPEVCNLTQERALQLRTGTLQFTLLPRHFVNQWYIKDMKLYFRHISSKPSTKCIGKTLDDFELTCLVVWLFGSQ